MPRLVNRYFFAILITLTLLSCCGQTAPEGGFVAPECNNRDRIFNTVWHFYRGDVSGAEKPGFDDSGWREINLPHYWSIENVAPREDPKAIDPFSKKSPGTCNTGYFMAGSSMYRKHFKLTNRDTDIQVSVLCDGGYKSSRVWINGYYLGLHPNGYTPFIYPQLNTLTSPL